jgi:hypothetical protein
MSERKMDKVGAIHATGRSEYLVASTLPLTAVIL